MILQDILPLILNKGYFVIFENQFLVLIVRHSYGIYLSHIIILNYIKTYACNEIKNIWLQIAGYCFWVLTALGIAIISEELIEKKFISVL